MRTLFLSAAIIAASITTASADGGFGFFESNDDSITNNITADQATCNLLTAPGVKVEGPLVAERERACAAALKEVSTPNVVTTPLAPTPITAPSIVVPVPQEAPMPVTQPMPLGVYKDGFWVK